MRAPPRLTGSWPGPGARRLPGWIVRGTMRTDEVCVLPANLYRLAPVVAVALGVSACSLAEWRETYEPQAGVIEHSCGAYGMGTSCARVVDNGVQYTIRTSDRHYFSYFSFFLIPIPLSFADDWKAFEVGVTMHRDGPASAEAQPLPHLTPSSRIVVTLPDGTHHVPVSVIGGEQGRTYGNPIRATFDLDPSDVETFDLVIEGLVGADGRKINLGPIPFRMGTYVYKWQGMP